jgi:ankyrin repeat protein
MSNPSPRKRLPVNPSIKHLQKQAKRLARQNNTLKLAEAQHQLARDYGCKNWAELSHMVETMSRGADQLYNVKRKIEPLPTAARKRDLEQIRKILREDEFTQYDLDSGLACATWYGETSNWPERKIIADLLLDHGADPDGQYGQNYGPIVFGTAECVSVEGLEYLIKAGANVTFRPLKTKYGLHCPLSHILGTYIRSKNDAKHRYIDILLQHGAYIPSEVTPPILAIHRGDAQQLGQLIESDSLILQRTFSDMPYGNMLLQGATLLHCAVELGEIECIAELLKRGADINARADVTDGISGQTPIFHAIATNQGDNFATLKYLVKEHGQKIDMSIRATWHRPGEVQSIPMTPLKSAVYASREEEPSWKRATPEEIALLRSLNSNE